MIHYYAHINTILYNNRVTMTIILIVYHTTATTTSYNKVVRIKKKFANIIKHTPHTHTPIGARLFTYTIELLDIIFQIL